MSNPRVQGGQDGQDETEDCYFIMNLVIPFDFSTMYLLPHTYVQ